MNAYYFVIQKKCKQIMIKCCKLNYTTQLRSYKEFVSFSKMLKKKLNLPESLGDKATDSVSPTKLVKENDDETSKFFDEPVWRKFYNLEISLNKELANYEYQSKIDYIYNPLEYTAQVHCNYLQKYLKNKKDVLMIGMNPGPNGMLQTGVPFGNINTVRNLMKLSGEVEKPSIKLHPKRPISGLSCKIEEPSGERLWNLLNELSEGLENFSKKCFVHNFCPLAFFDKQGRNITPSELKGKDKINIRDICLKYLREEIKLLQPQIVIAIGSYVNDTLKLLAKSNEFVGIQFLLLPHPSPRSINNTNWPEKGKIFFESNNLIKYLKNEN
ncbi:single-strand selective monofunctional uracil DNA glycosylase [Condylostylus longicornis]|uniref:single-strand selective monofunctional uracil DNA glycosylase n=1 Tax=Condylostylus longicornis TaxID=2530218 RepID=UPI00244DAF25|nr:single-strand selective monofunctional uracil DNA glycosylase [Condylostylus longicornis]